MTALMALSHIAVDVLLRCVLQLTKNKWSPYLIIPIARNAFKNTNRPPCYDYWNINHIK